MLTYASGYDANIVVWIAREFRDEHRQALDWLNQRTDENTEFFGVVVELWKIDDSRPAVNFNLVSTPNEWRKGNVSVKSTGAPTSERSERYRAFFQGLIDILRNNHSFTRATKGQPESGYYFSAGHGQRVKYGASFAGSGKARIEVYIDNADRDWNKGLFDKLVSQMTAIELELGESLEWERLDNRRASRISAVRAGSIDDDQETLEQIQDWMVDRLLKFKEVFGPRLAELT